MLSLRIHTNPLLRKKNTNCFPIFKPLPPTRNRKISNTFRLGKPYYIIDSAHFFTPMKTKFTLQTNTELQDTAKTPQLLCISKVAPNKKNSSALIKQ